MNYASIVSENKELLKKLTKANESLIANDVCLAGLKSKLEESDSRHQKSNQALLNEIMRLNEELENCEKCEELKTSVNKYKEDMMFYRNQCDSLSAQMSRMQAKFRVNTKSH